MPYLLDANVFIDAKNRDYGLDFCPAFWEWLLRENATGTVLSIERVGDEFEAGEDELADWAEARGPEFFVKPTAAMAKSLVVVNQWAQDQDYETVAVSRFLEGADYHLVAHAHSHGQIVAYRTSCWGLPTEPSIDRATTPASCHARSNRSAFMTLVHAATKSLTNLPSLSSWA